MRDGRIAAFLARPWTNAALAALNGDGEETRVVGGAVRNLLLDEPIADIDLATTALPAETMRRGEAAGFRAIPTGIGHGTVTLARDGAVFEVTTLRRDVATDGRRATVAFGRDFREDALRRDFTINALFLSIDGRLHDEVGGLADLAARRVRFIGEADARIAEDYLRILRFFRFHARYGRGPPDAAGYRACIAGRAGLDGLSRERVRSEMLKLLVAPGAADAVDAMAGAGLLGPVLGGAPRPGRFRAAAGETSAAAREPAFRLAALTLAIAEDAHRLRERLRLSNAEFDRIAALAVALEALSGRTRAPSLAALRRLAHEVGTEAVVDALVLRDAAADADRRAEAHERIAQLRATPPFLLSGRDVLARGVPAGPDVGLVLETARRGWIEAGCPAGEAEQARFIAHAATAIGTAGG